MKLDARSFVRPHDLLMRSATFGWPSGLPIGSGRMGGLVYQPEGWLEWSLNRLEVSQSCFYTPAPRDRGQLSLPLDPEGRPIDHARVKALADAGDWAELERICRRPFVYQDRQAEQPEPPAESFWPVAGWLRLHPREFKADLDRRALAGEPCEARLDLAEGRVIQRFGTPRGEAVVTSFVLREPEVWLIRVTGPGAAALLRRIELVRPTVDGALPEVRTSAGHDESGAVWLTVEGERPSGFRYAVAARLTGADGALADAGVELETAADELLLVVTVRTCQDAADPLAAARAEVERIAPDEVDRHAARHAADWLAFWDRSVIETDDAFLDGLWYAGLYAIAASNGRDTHVVSEACGISGLWQATDRLRWSNNWVLDVNIQEAYACCYAANHLELTDPFVAGVQARVPEAAAIAREFFGLDGLAMSAPGYYAWYYHCSGPWYALYLWLRYDLTRDRAYLREIYPILAGMSRFYAEYLTEGEDGRLHLWPSNSPENRSRAIGISGWCMTTHDPAIDLALLKHLFRRSAEAAEALGIDAEPAARWHDAAARITDYHFVPSPHGTVIADSVSELPPDEVELRHASRLMAIWPVGELGLDSPPELQQIARQTVVDTAARAEIVPHTFGWIAAAAARLGLGEFALRHLLEKGAEPMLLPNGLFAEETSRGLSELGVDIPEWPHQPLLEGSSCTAAAVCEMLLQSHEGCLRLFPALPDRVCNARFAGLRASGGFLVSAELADRQVAWIEVEATVPGTCQVLSPWPRAAVSRDGQVVATGEGVVSFTAAAGERFVLHPADAAPAAPAELSAARPAEPSVRRRETRDGMHVWLGRDAETDLREQIEAFVGRHWNGNQRQSRHVTHRFMLGTPDFARAEEVKALLPARHRILMVESCFRFLAPDTRYHPNRRYGWLSGAPEAVSWDGPDALRSAGLASDGPTVLRLDLHRGIYGLMFILGDPSAETWPTVSVAGQGMWRAADPLPAGRWAAPVLAVSLHEDGPLEVTFDAEPGHRWAGCALFVRRL